MRWFILFLVVLAGCSTEQEVIKEQEGATSLTITIIDEQGMPLKNVALYLNGNAKGETREYGQSTGTRALVVSPGRYIVTAEKEGYARASVEVDILTGNRDISLTMEKARVTMLVIVTAQGKEVPEVVVELKPEDDPLAARTVLTDEFGIASFERVDNGPYLVTAGKEEYQTNQKELRIDLVQDGQLRRETFELVPLPHLNVLVISDVGPLDNTEVSLFTKADYNAPRSLPSQVKTTNEEGFVLFRELQYGEEYVLVARREGFPATIKSTELEEGQTAVQIQMSEE